MKYLFSILTILIFAANNLVAQCYPDRHNTTWFHAWTSCEKAPNPNENRPESHWIMYDLGHKYKLHKVHFWNLNDPDNLDSGVKTMIIDYSPDGHTWTAFGERHFEKATGESIYEGGEAFDFDGVEARYLLFTVKETYGGNCAGFSEIKIGVSPLNAVEITQWDLQCDYRHNRTVLSWTLGDINPGTTLQIQRSDDGNSWKNVFTTAIDRQEHKNGKFSYPLDDKHGAYYRVALKTATGETVFSDAVYCSQPQLQVKAYPNPFATNLNIRVLGDAGEPVFYELVDVLGRKIATGTLNPGSLIYDWQMKVPDIMPGNYFLIVRQGQKVAKLKLTKM